MSALFSLVIILSEGESSVKRGFEFWAASTRYTVLMLKEKGFLKGMFPRQGTGSLTKTSSLEQYVFAIVLPSISWKWEGTLAMTYDQANGNKDMETKFLNLLYRKQKSSESIKHYSPVMNPTLARRRLSSEMVACLRT